MSHITRADFERAMTRAALAGAHRYPLTLHVPGRDDEAVRMLRRLEVVAAAGTIMADARDALTHTARRLGHALATRG